MANTLRQGGALSACVLSLMLMGVSRPQAQANGPLPAGWLGLDIGGPAVMGSQSFNNGTFTVDGAGTDIGGTSDQFRFVYRELQGDVDFRIRVTSLENVDAWTKAGAMIRASLQRRAMHAFAYVSAGNGVGFLRRTTTGGQTASTNGGAGAAPIWLRIVRQGTQFTAYRSTNAVNWTSLGSQTMTMPARIYVGLAVTSRNPNVAATASFTEEQQQGGSGLPAPWTNRDIGSPALAGSASASGGTFTVRGAGTDIWDAADQFQFVDQPMQGDVEVIARVASLQQVHGWSKAGVMIRESRTAGSKHALSFASATNGWGFQRRIATGGSSFHTAGPGGAAPGWLRLVREGNLFSAYQSTDGNTWSFIASDTMTMASTVYVGLAVTSHQPTALATATFTNVVVRAPTSGNQPPTVSLWNPAPGATFTAPASIGLAAAAGDPDGAVIKVDFYSGSQLLGSDTTNPFGLTWNGIAAGNYALRAVATDSDGATATSPIVNITVSASAPSNQPPSVTLTAPAAGSYTAPANFTITATATDADGTIARVDFYRGGTTLIASDTTSPYSVPWSNVAAGSYTLTAVARDDDGAPTTSPGVTVNVTSSTALPSPWANQDIGGPTPTGSASAANGTFTVRAGGADIWDNADQFQFVHQPAQGNVEIVARVASLQQTDDWSKGGVMIRESLAANSKHAFMLASVSNGWAFQRRAATSGASDHASGPGGVAPGWVRLVREGNLFSAYQSADGSNWTFVASDTIPMASNVFVGLALTSHNPALSVTATFTNVLVRTPTPTNQPPTVSITSPASGATFTAPATIALAAAASDTDGAVAKVEFRAGSQLIGTDTTSPFGMSWTNVAAGNYTVTAVATDNNGATATSAIPVTVNGGGSPPPRPTTVVFVASTNHASSVTSYSIAIRRAGDPATANPVATRDLGKPPIVNGEISVDISTLVNPLAAGSYYAIVSALGPGGTTPSTPSANFTK